MIMRNLRPSIGELRAFLILWITQSLSGLGSSMTNFALVIWSYQQRGSALVTSLLAVCSYAPYVILSIIAGTLSDRWNKKLTMLASDSFAALCSLAVLILVATGRLRIWHLYAINALNGLMNTVQQPAADVAISVLAPPKHYQKISGMRSFSNSLTTVLTPMFATALLSFSSIRAVILFDLATFLIAFVALLFFVRIPQPRSQTRPAKEPLLAAAGSGLRYLKDNRGILDLILLLAVVNFTASIFSAALPAMVLPRAGGGETALGLVNAVTGIATMLGSILAVALPPPRNRVRTILNCLLFSMSTENLVLAFGRGAPAWCLGAVLGWIFIPLMNANMDVVFRTRIPIGMQGRVYSARNSLQFFTIPLGYLCGGLLVDEVFEPFMAAQAKGSPWIALFGEGKGSGAAFLFFVIGIGGALSCLPFRADRHIRELEG